MRHILTAGIAGLIILICNASPPSDSNAELLAAIAPDAYAGQDSLGRHKTIVGDDTVYSTYMIYPGERRHLDEDDYEAVAQRLDVEVPAMKAVVKIEAGSTGRGFSKEGPALINFDLSVFRRNAARRGINLEKYRKSHPEVFKAPDIRKYGSQQAAQNARLESALEIDSVLAIESSFWGMFQIGGFNWKLCGTSSPQEFMRRMETSEQEQLNLFANFLENTGLVKHMRTRNWAAFARGYNGPSYAARKYHTRLSTAYANAKKQARN